MVFLTTLVHQVKSQVKIAYYLSKQSLHEKNRLIATVDGDSVELIGFDQNKCLNVYCVGDFNDDGYKDVAVEIVNGCGGNCCGNAYQFHLYNGHAFVKTHEVGYDWNGMAIDSSQKHWKFTVETLPQGIAHSEMCKESVEIWKISGYKLTLLEKRSEEKRLAIKEIRSDAFSANNTNELTMTFDIDGDGRDDTIKCWYWERWGAIAHWSLLLANGQEVLSTAGGKRIGILETKTLGFHDLVLDCNTVVKWNGEKYE